MSDTTTLLYTLSTLAQTCAALAALVGAIGLYRLQSLQGSRRDLLREIQACVKFASGVNFPDRPIEDLLGEARTRAQGHPLLPALLRDFALIPGRVRRSAAGLVVFEAWNLCVIGASLVGFNYVPQLVASPVATYWLVWLTGIGTVAMTAYCVFTWVAAATSA